MCALSNKKLIVCVNERLGYGQKSCARSGSRALIKILKKLFTDKVSGEQIEEQVCLGRCEEGIIMRIAPGGPFFTQVKERDLDRIVQSLIEFVPEDRDKK